MINNNGSLKNVHVKNKIIFYSRVLSICRSSVLVVEFGAHKKYNKHIRLFNKLTRISHVTPHISMLCRLMFCLPILFHTKEKIYRLSYEYNLF